MSQHTTRSRYKQLLERKRQSRRKLALRRLAALMLLVIVIGLVLGLIFSIRGCSKRNAQSAETPKQRVSKPDSEISKIQLAFAHDFRPGPAFVAVDDKRVYVGALTPGKDDAPPTTLLAAFGFNENEQRDPLWQSPEDSTFMQMGISGGAIIAVPAAGETLQRFDGDSGKVLAEIEADPVNAEIAMDSQVVIAGYVETNSAHPAIRLAAYNAQTGKSAWSRRSKLPGLSSGIDACCGATPRVELRCWDGLCAYRLHNVVGLLTTTGKGKLVRPEYAASGHIAVVQLDNNKKGRTAAYIIAADKDDPTLHRLIRLPIDDAMPAKRMLEFYSNSGEFMLFGDAGNVLLGYTTEEGKAKLVCFRKDEAEPALVHSADAGVSDICNVPGAAGEFIVATNSKFKDGEAVGRGKILRVRLNEAAEALEIATYRQPVTWVVPFKRDCLVLVRGGGMMNGGGQIVRYSADSGKLKLLRRAKYPLLDPMHSADRTSLMVSSYTESYALDKGGPLQVLVFK